jgi:anhydro-N-acetylmuramic acid kinase
VPFLSNLPENRRIIGLMSGTSCDGIDAAAVEVSGSGSTLRAHLEHFLCVPYSEAMREKLLRAGEMQAPEIAVLNFELGELFAQAGLQLMREAQRAAEDFDAIGSHGHTICHLPAENATLQIGESAVIASRTGITTVADFRVADVAEGGQGAPLVPYIDWCLLRNRSTPRIIQNIGGVGNCTILPANCELDKVRAWDTGPGNMIIDGCVRILTAGEKQFDEGGTLASQGKADEDWLRVLMQHEYFFRPPPATCGREEFGKFFATRFCEEGARRALSHLDIIATATALTAESIAHSYRMHAAPLLVAGNCEVILGGGGAFNPTLRRMLQVRLPAARVLTHEDAGIRSDAKEAMAFAILAHETFNGVPTNVTGATGARRSVVSGKIARGANDSNN